MKRREERSKEEREHEKKIKAEREEKDAARKTACTLPETQLSDFKLQTSVLSGLIVAKLK